MLSVFLCTIIRVNETSIKTVPFAEAQDISLYPGDLYIHTGGPEPRIWTLLGSCVSVALFNRKAGIGAICHAQLPRRRLKDPDCSEGCPENCTENTADVGKFRYLTCAFRQMVRVLTSQGVPASRLSAYVFGGSEAAGIGNDFFRVGAANVEMAHALLQKNRISVLFEDTGGKTGRSLYFFPATGRLYYRYHGERDFHFLSE
jgi:chemotaxis protein CheD